MTNEQIIPPLQSSVTTPVRSANFLTVCPGGLRLPCVKVSFAWSCACALLGGLCLSGTVGCGVRKNRAALDALKIQVQTLQTQLVRADRRLEQLANRMLVMSHRLESQADRPEPKNLEVVRLVPRDERQAVDPYVSDSATARDPENDAVPEPPIEIHITGEKVTRLGEVSGRLPRLPPKRERNEPKEHRRSAAPRAVGRVRTFEVRRGHSTSSAQSTAEFGRALDAYRAGFPQKAEKYFTKFLKDYPEDDQIPHARYWLGICQFELAKYKDAVKSLEEFVNRHPRSDKLPDVLLKAGVAYERLGNRGRSRALMERIIAKYPNSAMADLARARLDG